MDRCKDLPLAFTVTISLTGCGEYDRRNKAISRAFQIDRAWFPAVATAIRHGNRGVIYQVTIAGIPRVSRFVTRSFQLLNS